MASEDRLDIHNYERQVRDVEERVRDCSLSQRNKDLIFGYRDACLRKNVCGRVRLVRVMGILVLLGRLLNKDFDAVTKADLEDLVSQLLQRTPAYSPETLATYKGVLRIFMTWVLVPDDFPTKHPPAMVSWLHAHVRARDKRRLERRELLLPSDIEKLLAICHNPRDRAIISMLWELGCRISEIGNLQLKHLTKVQHGYTIDMTGKTGGRCPLIVASAPDLTHWLNHHPFPNDAKNPLWVHYQYAVRPRHVKYPTLRTLLQRHFAHAGITKPFHPHIFRHSRATYVIAKGIMTESMAKRYFGWTPDSRMLSTYLHLIDEDVNQALLRAHNLVPSEQPVRDASPIACPVCKALNSPECTFCGNCQAVLDSQRASVVRFQPVVTDERVLSVLKVLVDAGLLDQAAKAVHDANLGRTLKRLVHTGTDAALNGDAPASRESLGRPTIERRKQ